MKCIKICIDKPVELAKLIAHELVVELGRSDLDITAQTSNAKDESSTLLSVKQAAKYFDCCENTIYNWIKKETYDPDIISVVRNGNRIYLKIKM